MSAEQAYVQDNAERASVEDRAALIVGTLLAVRPGEQVALVTDALSALPMVAALEGAVADAQGECTVMRMPLREPARRNELTPVIVAGLARADCLIGLTGGGGAPTYASEVKALYEAKTLRGISMVMRTLENFTTGGALADYAALRKEGLQLAALWRTARRIRVTTPSGTDLRSTIAGEEVMVECGYATEPGQEAAFSDGEVSQMPNQNAAEGRIVVNGPVAHLGSGDAIELEVVAGRVRSITGGDRADELARIVRTVPEADNIAEIGIGLNPACRRNGDFEEEKKARGYVHVALGDNVFYGGDVRCGVHMDMVLYEPSVWLDDTLVVDAGTVVPLS